MGLDPIPDWRIYKVEGIPELEKLQRLLAAKGLKDPWIRNEVWRYHPDYYSPMRISVRKTFFRGFKWAAIAMVATIIVNNFRSKGDDHH